MEYRRNLPHVHPDDAWLFLTWRLRGTLPLLPGRPFAEQDRELDRADTGAHWMANPRIAELVADAVLRGRDRGYYELSAWCVMPNHVHMLVLPRVLVPRTMHWLKGSTARLANQILGRTGESFWQEESYDHFARSARERDAIAAYIERNPVSAGLAGPGEYKWCSGYADGTG